MSEEAEKIVIYHNACADGMTAAWVMRMLYPDAKFWSAQYNQSVGTELFEDKDVFIVDFSYKRKLMEVICEKAKSVTVYDHHKTALEELKGFGAENLTMVLDMTRSGGNITWDRTFPGKPRPWLVLYTEDRDLWRWALPNSKEVNACVASFPITFESWDTLDKMSLDTAITEGRAVLRYQDRVVEGLVKVAGRAKIGGVDVPVVNTTMLISEVGHRLSENEPFAASFFVQKDGTRVYSLRSQENGTDVSEIAKMYGGGGHAHAAGFSINL